MKLPKILITGTTVLVACIAINAALLAEAANRNGSAHVPLASFVDAQGLRIRSDGPVGGQMKVIIVGPNGDRLVNKIVPAGFYDWTSFVDDGTYRFEAYILLPEQGVQDDSDSPEGVLRSSNRTFGTFRVKGGTVVVPEPEEAWRDDELSQAEPGILQRLISASISLMIPAAHAQDITISGTDPDLFFQDTSGGLSGTGEWTIEGDTASLEIRDQENGSTVIDIQASPSDGHLNSILISSNGDISIANGSFFFDKSLKGIGINTTTPGAELHMISSSPEPIWEDSNDGTQARIQYNSPYFTMEGNSQQDIFELDATAPQGSMFIDSSGNVGLGTGAPTAKLHVIGDAKFEGDFRVSSSRKVKHAFSQVEPREVLATLEQLTISEWAYKQEEKTTRHMGPVSEEFHAAFGLGQDEEHVSPVDLAGVALAAAKGLQAENAALRAELAELRQRQVEQDRAFETQQAQLALLNRAVHSVLFRQAMIIPQGPQALNRRPFGRAHVSAAFGAPMGVVPAQALARLSAAALP